MAGRTVHVPVHETRDASYDVIAGCGALDDLPALLAGRCPAHAYAVIADHRVAELHGTRLMERLTGAGLTATLFTFASGEWNKSRETWSELTDALLKARIGRDGAIVAFGGGVAGDLAGFVAATYLRGIPCVQVPTTLLAMIDSAIGGKTGVDVPAGKNLVGAFHQPNFVLADVALLATLPRVQLAAGAAEAVKHGIIADAGYAAALCQDAGKILGKDLDALERAVARSVAIKASVVSRDEKEAGLRQVLNFGHTIGHAVETLAGYELLHGEAIAIGMAAEARLAESLGIAEAGVADRVREALECYALPLAIPESLAADRLVEVMQSDKKVRGGQVRCALPQRIGVMAQSADGEWTVDVPLDAMHDALNRCR